MEARNRGLRFAFDGKILTNLAKISSIFQTVKLETQ